MQIDSRLFARMTGRRFVHIRGHGSREIFGGKLWKVLDYVHMAWKELTGEDRRTTEMEVYSEASAWEVLRISHRDDIIEVRLIGGAV